MAIVVPEKPTVQWVLENLMVFNDDERGLYVQAMLSLLLPTSQRKLRDQQLEFKAKRPALTEENFKAMVSSTLTTARGLVEFEMSKEGTEIREVLDLPPLTLDTVVPVSLRSHWGFKHLNKPQAMSHLSDSQIASKVRMLGRNDLDHELIVTAARDRIALLSYTVAGLRAEMAEREQQHTRVMSEAAKALDDMHDLWRAEKAHRELLEGRNAPDESVERD
jgi:hypothetical protein